MNAMSAREARFDSEDDRLEPARLVSQRYFNVLRLLLVGVFLVLGKTLNLGQDAPMLYSITVFANLVLILAFGFPGMVERMGRERAITIQLICDMVMFGVVMWSSGGFDNSLALVIVAYLAAGGLVMEGRMTLFSAALASTILLADTLWREFFRTPHDDISRVGMACLSFFMVAMIARMLARRVHENATLALARGEALGRQEAINKKIIEDMQDGVVVVSSDGRVLRANPRASELLGSQLMGNMLLADVDGSLMMQGNAADFGDVVQRFGPGGRMLRYRRVQAEPQLQSDDVEGDSLIYLRDFEEVQQEVQQVKLAALGRLTASMAHEIRNPLNAIRQSADLLAEDLDASQLHQRLLRIVRDNTQRIDRLIREVLSLGRFTHRLGEPLQLKPFIDNLLAELTLEDEKERKVYEASIDEQRCMIFDRLHLHQILSNLLTNARRYCSGKPGSVRLFTEAGVRFTRLHIVDDGEGISGSDRERVFEPFFTRAAKGTGLGLYIARELAEANGGSLQYAGNMPGAHFVLSGLYELEAGQEETKDKDA